MIFVRYESFGQYIRLYKVTSIVLLINTILFGVSLFAKSELFDIAELRHWAPHHMELWRYVTSVFLHNGFDHFLFNSFAIFVFAPPLEFMLGKGRYALLYLGSGIFGNLISMIAYNDSLVQSVGASGAIYGLYGAYLFLVLFRRQSLDPQSRKTVVLFLALGAIYTVAYPAINWAAHLGGLAGGLIIFSRIVSSFRKNKP